jgi:ferritin heavy chain
MVLSKGELSNGHSLVRMHYADEAVSAINEQINVEYNISYVVRSSIPLYISKELTRASFGKLANAIKFIALLLPFLQYHAMSAYFDRDNVALPGFAKYFRDQSEEEKGHAQKLIDFQNTRGGRVKLLPLAAPEMEFSNEEKGDGL